MRATVQRAEIENTTCQMYKHLICDRPTSDRGSKTSSSHACIFVTPVGEGRRLWAAELAE